MSEVPPCGSGNHVPHSERANTLQWALCAGLERYRVTLSDFFQSDHRHVREDFRYCGSLRNSRWWRTMAKTSPASARRLQLFRAPLRWHSRWIPGCRCTKELERSGLYLRIEVEGYHVASISCLRNIGIAEWVTPANAPSRSASVYCSHFISKKPQKRGALADVDVDVCPSPVLAATGAATAKPSPPGRARPSFRT